MYGLYAQVLVKEADPVRFNIALGVEDIGLCFKDSIRASGQCTALQLVNGLVKQWTDVFLGLEVHADLRSLRCLHPGVYMYVIFIPYLFMYRLTDGRTDGPTDRPTDRTTDRPRD